MTAYPSVTVTPFLVADLLSNGRRLPVNVHVIEHPDARILVDTGVRALHPIIGFLEPRIHPFAVVDPASVDIVVNTHLHFDHCGNNHLFAGRPLYVQQRELDDARSMSNYTIPEWVDVPGLDYVVVDDEHELLPGLRLLPAPGHSNGLQVVVIETDAGPIVVGGDVATGYAELDQPQSAGQRRVMALKPDVVWLTHENEPWRRG
jgi:N-acyl homoserine lactone hydrolase